MKRTETVETEYCDFCERNDGSYLHCCGCGKAVCFECRGTVVHEYPHGVFFGGSNDGLYCIACEERLAKKGDQLFAAYKQIQRLRNEHKGYYEDFKKRCDVAEERVKALLPTRS